MPKKQKPSVRRPVGLEVRSEIERRYPQDYLDRLTDLVPLRDMRHRADFTRDIIGIAVLFVIKRSHEGGTPPSKMRNQIEAVRKAARALVEAAEALDDDTQRALYQAADLVTVGDYMEKLRDTFGGFVGDTRFKETIVTVESLAGWCESAMGELQPGHSGRSGNEPLQNAAVRLRDIWKRATGEEPTLTVDRNNKTSGAFLDFVEMVLRPVAGDANFEHVCRKALYG